MEIHGVPDLPEIHSGDSIGTLIDERIDLSSDDILVVASTIVSKATGKTASLADYEPVSDRAINIADRLSAITGDAKDPRFAQAVLEESTDLIMTEPFILSETHCGHIGVNAGIDRSNTGGAELLLLPRDPSGAAASIRSSLSTATAPPVIISDTCGRPFRNGQCGVAIGWDGMPASRDWRGEADRDGRELGVTVQAVVDELAAAANLVAGEGSGGTPAVVIRDWEFGQHEGSQTLYRSPESDFVRQALKEWTYRPQEGS